MTEQYFTDDHQLIYELQTKINHLRLAIGRMFESGLITDDMIAEALDNNTATDDTDSLGVIFCSWGGDKIYKEKAQEQFALTLATIKSYQ
jgi:hypothetical protein